MSTQLDTVGPADQSAVPPADQSPVAPADQNAAAPANQNPAAVANQNPAAVANQNPAVRANENATGATRGRVAKLTPFSRGLRLVTSSDDREFLPAALEILETPASPKRVAFIWIVCLMMAAALGWSYVARLDIYAVASGRIQPSGRSKVIQPLDPGKVKTIAIDNGMRVKAGDLLLELDSTDAYAERDAAAADLEAFDAEIPRRRAEIEAVLSGAPSSPKVVFPSNVGPSLQMRELNVLGAEMAQYKSSRETLKAQFAEKTATQSRLRSSIAAREQLIAVLNQRLSMKRELLARQAGPLTAVLDAQQQVEQELTNMAYDKGQLLETEAGMVSIESKMDEQQKQFIADQATKLADAERKRDHLAEDLLKAVAKADRVRLTAPISGTVQQLAVNTIGQVVTTGQPLLVIVPDSGTLEIEALVPNTDIGFLEVGQDAVIKIDAFPFSRYGTVDGKVVRVSRDAVYDKDITSADAATSPLKQNASILDPNPKVQGLVYPVTVELSQRHIVVEGKQVPLAAGMTATIEVRTGDRRVIDYLLSPLREIVLQSGHER
jgi:hemolysin D